MSEYQYYEFLAIDRPLTDDEMVDLRRISSRAQITPISFTNEYRWGDLKANPKDLMKRYFDAHVYIANWMTVIFMVRLPIEALAKEAVQALAKIHVLDFMATQTHWVITWCLEEAANHDLFDIEEGTDWMRRLAPIRDELMRGDLRSLYVGWLAAIDQARLDDSAIEPISVTGLGSLTSAQQALAQYLEVDEDLLVGAGMGSTEAQDAGNSQQKMEAWIDALARNEVTAILTQMLNGQAQQAESILKSRFAAWLRCNRGDSGGAPRRLLAELMANAEVAKKIRLDKQEREDKQREVQRQNEREAYLIKLSKDLPKAWQAAQEHIERRSGRGYDDACVALVDLCEAYALCGRSEQFQEELKKLMADHLRRKALVQRLTQAGLWKNG